MNKGTCRQEEEYSCILLHIKMLTVLWKSHPPNICMLSTKHSRIIMSASENFLLNSVFWLFLQNNICTLYLTKIRYLCLCWPFFYTNQCWTNSFNLSFSLRFGNSCVHEERDLVCMYSNKSIEIVLELFLCSYLGFKIGTKI